MSAAARKDQRQSDIDAFLDTWFRHMRHGECLEIRPLKKRRGARAEPRRWFNNASETARYVQHCVAKGNDVYIGALARKSAGSSETDVGSPLWLWGDLDYGTTGHAKPAQFATRQDALAAIRRVSQTLGADPTFLIDTGGGFHVWWALKEAPETEVWRDAIRRLGHALGADMNALDLPRILRVPGTKNFKIPESPRPVTLVEHKPCFIEIEQLLKLPAAPTEERSSTQKTRRVAGDTPFNLANDVPVDEVLSWLGVPMHREGSRIFCACPAHGGKNKSQMVVGGGDYNTARCFGDCQKSYSPVDLVASVKKLSPKDAVNAISEQFGFEGFGARVYNFNTRQEEQAQEEPWDAPIPLEQFSAPKWPQGVLEGPLDRFADGLSVSTQTPKDLPAVIALGVVSTAVGGKFVVEVRPDYHEPVHGYFSVAMPPGERKSAAFGKATAPLIEVERADDELRKNMPQSEDEEPPPALRLFVEDATPEAVSHHLWQQGGRIAVLSAEGGDIFEMMAGRYGDMPNIGVYLKGHASDPIRVDRIKRSSEIINRPALTVCVATQPSTLRTLASKPLMRGRGLVGRFLFSVPQSNIGHRKVDPPPMDPDVRNSYDRIIRRLISIATRPDGEPYKLSFTQAARDLYLDFAAKIEERLGEGGDLAKMPDWSNKLVGATIRVAALLHLANHADDDVPWEHPIDHDTLERSIHLTETYWIAHARIAFDLLSETENVESARRILAWIKRYKKTEFSVRDAHKGIGGKGAREDVVDPGLNVLVSHGYIRPSELEEPTGNRGRGRPRGARYLVNSKL